MSASQEQGKSRAEIKQEQQQQQVQEEESVPSASPVPEDDDSDAGKYILFQRSDDDDPPPPPPPNQEGHGDNRHHIIPKSPEELQWKRSVSMRGSGRTAALLSQRTQKYSPPLSIGMPSWTSMEDHAHEDYQEVEGGPEGEGEEEEEEGIAGKNHVITPAVKGRLGRDAIHPSMFRYPPSSPIKTSPPGGRSPVLEEGSVPVLDSDELIEGGGGGDREEEHSSDAGEEWLPPPTSARARPTTGPDTIKTARDVVVVDDAAINTTHDDQPPIRFPGGEPPVIKPQFVRESSSRGSSKATPPRTQHPSLVVDSSTSHDSAETPGRSLQGGRIQVVGGDSAATAGAPWSLVSHSRSIESGEESWGVPEVGVGPLPPVPTPDRRYGYNPVGTPYPYPHRGGGGGPPLIPPPPPSTSSPSIGKAHPPGYPQFGPPYGPNRHYDREGWSHYPPPPPHYEYGRYPYHPLPPPHPSYAQPYNPPPHNDENEPQDEDEPHPLLKDYNPNNDGIRPQFQNRKKSPSRTPASSAPEHSSAVDETTSADGPSPRRRRRRRNPEEKLASAAAMAAAAAAAAARAKQKKEKMAAAGMPMEVEEREDIDDEDEYEEEEIKTVASVDDEDIPAAKRAAMASAVALRAAAAGSPLAPPKAAAEVDFDIADPPLTPIHPPSRTAVLDSASLMTENDRRRDELSNGKSTLSSIGSRFSTYLSHGAATTEATDGAKRGAHRAKARGRFLRRDESDGRLYEVGDEKAEAKTSQALREGLDVRATKTAANTLLGTDSSKKRKKPAPSPSLVSASMQKSENQARPPVKFDGTPPRKVPSSIQPSYYRAIESPAPRGAAPSRHHPYPPPPSRYDDPYYLSYPPAYHPSAPGYSPYPYPPPYYSAYPTPPRSGEHPLPPPHPHELNPFSPPRASASRHTPLTPIRSTKKERL
eukprot:CCRYP_006174-RA/>CCRYP_006174-RA protein AED:0.05 eAED:0.05 QI:510/0.66/0.5/1/0.33/0.25/4/0/926